MKKEKPVEKYFVPSESTLLTEKEIQQKNEEKKEKKKDKLKDK